MAACKMRCSNLSALLAVALFCSCAQARLSPSGEVWITAFDPPYDDRTVKVQLKVLDWWTGSQDVAVLRKGTKFPVLDDNCNWDADKCPSWTLPADVQFEIGPPTTADAHRLNIFMMDTGTRVPIFSAPYERATPGCSGQFGAVCCGSTEYTLQRDQTDHAVFKMWVSRVNGTALYDGSQPTNARSATQRLTIRTGYYSSSISWPNMFFDKKGVSSDGKVQASVEFAAESATVGSYLDVTSTLINNYMLLVPQSDPGAPGFVIPNDKLGEQAAAMDTAAWSACRAAKCGDPLGAYAPAQGPTPFAASQSVTSASIIADSWNALKRSTTKKCTVLGNGQQQFMNSDLTMGATHAAQFVSCDYPGTYIVPVVKLPRQVIEAGNTAPPPPSPPPPSPPPPSPPTPSVLPTSSPVPPSPKLTSTPPPLPRAPVVSPPPPPPPVSRLQGPAISVVLTLPAYTPAEFNATGQEAFMKAMTKAAVGAAVPPTYRFRSIKAADEGGRRRRSRALLATAGTQVDAVAYYAPADTTPASLVLSLLQTKPSAVFPTSQFGEVKVSQAVLLNCITPCGDNGKPGPRVTPSGVSCTCECDSGWSTLMSQPFESFKYCTAWVGGSSPGAGGGDGTTTNGGDGTGGYTKSPPGGDGHNPASYPPPAPKDYKEDSGMSVGAIIAIVIVVLLVGVVGYLAWKTKCGCWCFTVWSGAFVTFWHCCISKKKQQVADEGADPEEAGENYDDPDETITEQGRSSTKAKATLPPPPKKKKGKTAGAAAAGEAKIKKKQQPKKPQAEEGEDGEGNEVAAAAAVEEEVETGAVSQKAAKSSPKKGGGGKQKNGKKSAKNKRHQDT